MKTHNSLIRCFGEDTLPRLYYVSQGKSREEHIENITNVCRLGVRLVQLRLKDYPFEEWLETAVSVKKICDEYSVQLIINDSIEIAKQTNSGVHLGKKDSSLDEAKRELPSQIIGATANTLEDCLLLASRDVDYIGLGPFRFTTTKKNLSPILGLSGYEEILKKLRQRGIDTPVYAIGGIEEEDISSLISVGVSGIAASGLLTGITSDSRALRHLVVK